MQVALQRILVPTDFSPSANQARDYAATLADKFDAELHLLHVVVEPYIRPAQEDPRIRPQDILPQFLHNAEAELKGAMSDVKLASGRPLICTVKVGYPVDEILKYSNEKQIDLIVMGTQGHRGLSRLLLGSVAEKLVRISTCPVLTVHPPA